MRIEPNLTDFGLGIPFGVKLRQRKRKFKEEKAMLLSKIKQFEVVCDWLKGVDKTNSINDRHTSYFLKHIAERRAGIGHISNGVFIAAAIHCGFKYKVTRSYPNVVFNMCQDSIQDKYEESQRYEKYPEHTLTFH